LSAAAVTIPSMSEGLPSPDMSLALEAPKDIAVVSEWLLSTGVCVWW